MIVDLGNLEAILPRSQQSRGEQWNQGERIRVVITNVSKESKGPQIEVSRTSPELLERLFEMEVPEIYDGTVVIKSCVREPGERAKIAVVSNERDVDPVGACVGMKGSRVQAIIRELRGENMDIRSEEEIKREVAEQMGAMIASGAPVPLAAIQVVTAQQADTLGEHGVTDIDGLANTSVDDLVEFLDVSLDEAEKILNAARAVIEIREKSLQAATEEGAERDDAATGEVEQHAVSAELDGTSTAEVEPNNEMTAAGYDEAVEQGVASGAEADPISEDELSMQDAGRDLRPDAIAPADDLEAAEHEEETAAETDAATVASPGEAQTSSALESNEVAAIESSKEEKQ